MIDGRADAQVRIMRAMERMGRLQRELAHAVARENDGVRATMSIARLLDQRGEAGVSDVAEALRVDLSVASRQVSELVDAGFVERTVADGDRRARSLRLTPAGQEYADRVRASIRRLADEAFADWSADELRTAADSLERIVASTARAAGCAASSARAHESPPVALAAAP